MSVTPQTNCTLAEMADQLRNRDDFVICGHVSPDGDCLGSQLALASALGALGKTVTCVYAKDACRDDGLAFLPGMEKVVPADEFDGACDTFVSVDVQIGKRIGNAEQLASAAKCRMSIDHHASDGRFAQFNYVDPDAAATCLLVWELIGYLGVPVSEKIATCCFAGLMTDTGSFQFSNADAACFAAASAMVEAGAQPRAIASAVYQSRRIQSLRLQKILLERLEVDEAAGLALSVLYAADFAQTGACPDDTESFIDVLRSLKGVRVACLLREQNGAVRGSLRAKDATDVSAIARGFGGGGHVAAAGFTIEDSSIGNCLDEVRARIYEALSLPRS